MLRSLLSRIFTFLPCPRVGPLNVHPFRLKCTDWVCWTTLSPRVWGIFCFHGQKFSWATEQKAQGYPRNGAFFFTLAQLGYTQRLRGPLPLKAHTPVSGFILCCSQPSSNTNPPTNLNVTLNDQTRLEDSKVKLLPTDSGVWPVGHEHSKTLALIKKK